MTRVYPYQTRIVPAKRFLFAQGCQRRKGCFWKHLVDSFPETCRSTLAPSVVEKKRSHLISVQPEPIAFFTIVAPKAVVSLVLGLPYPNLTIDVQRSNRSRSSQTRPRSCVLVRWCDGALMSLASRDAQVGF